MGHDNTLANTRASRVHGTARLFRANSITRKEPPLQPMPRGLELINSCAKFYANGAGMVTQRVPIAHLRGAVLDEPPTRQTSSSGPSKASIGTVAVMCSVLLVLPSLALATIVWWAATSRFARGLEVATGTGRALTVQSGSAAVAPQPPAAAQTASNDRSGIIIHKVKTQPITVDARGESDRE
jgi:hypothetical protein